MCSANCPPSSPPKIVASERSWPASTAVTPSTAANPAIADQTGTGAPLARTCPRVASVTHTVANTTARAVLNSGCEAGGDMAPPIVPPCAAVAQPTP
ncbi:hypothetical protein [Actinomadura madurae]|uniref:hypothetical protein n=1 Tax=Actinomadura madurae TaxID=1993 RepID=UPI0020D23B32|nr:hypothetical protein [Actinomadura madurae]MCQ0006755.1 hypothetical protein [Actinomadura madurae]